MHQEKWAVKFRFQKGLEENPSIFFLFCLQSKCLVTYIHVSERRHKESITYSTVFTEITTVLKEKLSLYSQFGEGLGKDCLSVRVGKCLMHVALRQIFFLKKGKMLSRWGIVIRELFLLESVSVNAGWRLIQKSGINIWLGTIRPLPHTDMSPSDHK